MSSPEDQHRTRGAESHDREFNNAVRKDIPFDATKLDGKCTEGITPKKSQLGRHDRQTAVLGVFDHRRYHVHFRRPADQYASAGAQHFRTIRSAVCSPPAISWVCFSTIIRRARVKHATWCFRAWLEETRRRWGCRRELSKDMKQKISMLIEEKIVRLARRKAAEESRPQDLIQDALEQYLKKGAALPRTQDGVSSRFANAR